MLLVPSHEGSTNTQPAARTPHNQVRLYDTIASYYEPGRVHFDGRRGADSGGGCGRRYVAAGVAVADCAPASTVQGIATMLSARRWISPPVYTTTPATVSG